jgi:outer membrane protein assembly factor BamA
MVDGYHYIARDSTFVATSITRAIRLRPGELYSRRHHSNTLSRLMSMGVFHYVNVRFADTLVGDSGMLDAHIYLSPLKKRTLQLELQAVTKSNNYSGPALNASYKNRNVFRGAELLLLNLNTNYETQFTGVQKGFNSYEIGGNAQLFFPRFLVPFRLPAHKRLGNIHSQDAHRSRISQHAPHAVLHHERGEFLVRVHMAGDL